MRIFLQPGETVNDVTQSIKDILNNLIHWQEPIEDILTVLEDRCKKNIDNQGYFFGRFKPLAEETKKQRARLGYNPSRPILVRSGTLRESFAITELGESSGELSNTTDYAIYHQLGGAKIPERVIMDIDDKMDKYIDQTISNFIDEVINDAFN